MEASETPEDRAYDLYLQQLARGIAEDVDAFCARAGAGDGALRERLLHLRWLLEGREALPGTGLPFEHLGEFRLLARLGEGGMGVVFLAEQQSLKRRVALKVIRPERVGSADAERRFQREAEALGRLHHPCVVQVFAAGEERGVRWLALEYVAGQSLEQLLRDPAAAPNVSAAVRIAADIASALEAAHSAGIVHRDVKPANILLDETGRARLTDFGLARDLGQPSASVSHAFLGTPYYAAPEQISGGGAAAGPRSDVYSLGATLYEMVAKRVPFPGSSTEQVLDRIARAPLEPPSRLNPNVSRDLEIVLLQALERDPERRYANAGAFAADLRAILELRPVAARPASLLRRATASVRRHPVRAALGGAVLGLAVALATAAALERRATAREELAAAHKNLADYRDLRDQLRALDAEVGALDERARRAYLGAADHRRRLDGQSERRALAASQDAAVFATLAALARAEPCAPDAAVIADLRAELYLELFRDSLAASDGERAAAYRRLVEDNDPTRRHAAELGAEGSLRITSDPPGAEVFLFRYVEQATVVPGGDHRLVPVPVSDPRPPVLPGTFALRVVAAVPPFAPGDLVLELLGAPVEGSVFALGGAGPLLQGDRLVAVDGEPVRDLYGAWVLGSAERRGPDGAPLQQRTFRFRRGAAEFEEVRSVLEEFGVEFVDAAGLAARGEPEARVLRGGLVESLRLPAGLQVRATAAPLALTPASQSGTTPFARDGIEPGGYLAVLRAPGREDLRLPVAVPRGGTAEASAALLPEGSTPQGFVYVAPGPVPLGGDAESLYAWPRSTVDVGGFWMQEHELTFEEYFEFLNDEQTRTEVLAAPETIRLPRRPDNAASGGFLSLSPEGTLLLPTLWKRWPVLGVSQEDALAYCRWRRNAGDGKGGSLEVDLPTEAEWEKAARGADSRFYPFGNVGVPLWFKTQYSRAIRSDTPFDFTPEPVLSFPIDESPYGIFDLAGSMTEWCTDPFDEGPGERFISFRGGAWNHVDRQVGRAAYRNGMTPKSANADLGIRLVVRRSR